MIHRKFPNKIHSCDKRPVSPTELGKYLKQMRETARLEISPLCRYLGVSRQTYLRYEAGERLPRDPYAFIYDFRTIIRAVIMARRRAGEL